MRMRLLISAMFLVGASMGVAANPAPVTVVDDGVTKVEKFMNVAPFASYELTAPAELGYQLYEAAAAPGITGEFTSLAATAYELFDAINTVALEPDHPGPRGIVINNLFLKDKLYLSNCAIRQCLSRAVAAA